MMEFAFKHFGLNYKNYIKINKNFIRPKIFLLKNQNFRIVLIGTILLEFPKFMEKKLYNC